MFIDYHTHHERCGHAIGALHEYVEQAIIKGLGQIGLSDHMPVIHIPREKLLSGLGMKVSELDKYVEEAIKLKDEYKRDIDVKVGIEADYIEGYEEEIEKLLTPYPFDYIIGSVHFLGEWDISDSRQMQGWNQKPLFQIFNDYYVALQNMAKSSLYDIVGHFDVVKKYGHKPKEDITELIKATLDAIKEANMAMEINASGLKKVVKEIFPAHEIIKQAVSLGIPFTLGSDAHAPRDVHSNINEGRRILKELNVDKIATFNRRKRIMISL